MSAECEAQASLLLWDHVVPLTCNLDPCDGMHRATWRPDDYDMRGASRSAIEWFVWWESRPDVIGTVIRGEVTP